jgi:hypothetical protein
MAVHETLPIAWQLMSHIRFDCAVQLPEQAAWQPAMQETVGGVPVQDALQRALMLAWHSAVHVVMSMLDSQFDEQLAMASVSHEVWQSKPPLLLQLPMHEPSHIVVQLASMPPVHVPEQLASSCAEHAAVKLRFVQVAWQFTLGGVTSQLAVELRSSPPPPGLQAGRKEALAGPAARVTKAADSEATKKASDRRSVISFLRGCWTARA